MKEQYFTRDSIKTLSNDWYKDHANPTKEKYQPFRIDDAALLLLDTQRYFLDPQSHAYVPSGPAILDPLNEIADLFVSKGRPVVATQHINSKSDANRMDDWWSEMITAEHDLVGLDPGIKVKPDIVFTKSQYDAFYKTDLFSWLEQKSIKQLVIGGLMTHLCCETTARSAFVRGYEVFFLADGTATYNQEFHISTLKNLAHGFAIISTVERLLGEVQ